MNKQESFYTVLDEMKEYAKGVTETTPANETAKRIVDWTERIEKTVMRVIQIDASDLCDACVLLMETIDAINEGKLAPPGNYPSEEEKAFVTDLRDEMLKTIERFKGKDPDNV